jgi:hypothetical protein
LPRPCPLMCGVRSVPAHGSGKPRGRCRLKLLLFRFPALAALLLALAGCMHEAGLVIMAGAGRPMVGEIAGGYRPAGDVQPPPFPLLGGLGGGPTLSRWSPHSGHIR